MRFVSPSLNSSTRMHRMLIAAGFLVPALLFAAAAWRSKADIQREGEATLLHAVAVLENSLRGHLQTEEMVLAAVADHLGGLDWKTIETPETGAFLRGLMPSADQIAVISITDQDGTVRATSGAPAQIGRIKDQTIFKTDRGEDLYISLAYSGRPSQPISLALIRRRKAPDGGFGGTIRADMDPAYLSRLFAEATPGGHGAVLIDSDGDVLGAPGHGLDARRLDDTLLRRIIGQAPGGLFSGRSAIGGDTDEIVSYQRVPGYPVWVGIAADSSALTSRWLGSVGIYAAAAAAGSLALAIASVLAMRRARAEREALTRLNLETERRLKAEQQINVARRMEIVGQLAAGVAHDFNNLLMIVMGNLDLIARAAKDNQRVQMLVAPALQASRRGARLTSSLLAFARRQVMRTQTLDINVLIQEFLPLIRESVGEQINVEMILAPDLHPCKADAGQLEAALLNVAINARDAMENGGTLTIATSSAYLRHEDLVDNAETEPGRFIAVALTDTGSGMAPEVAAKAFDPFFTTKDAGKGSGLGLSQVLGFVRQLGGHVTLESTPGRGSVVTLFLPQA
jgi:signal transduction histidine kinase